MPASDGSPVRSVARAVALLRCFEDGRRTRSYAELVGSTGLPKSTVVRLVAALEAEGLVWTSPGGEVRPGVELLRWGRLGRSRWQLPAAAREVLERCARDVAESVSVQVRHGLSRVVVERVEGPRTLRHVLHVGDRLPLGRGAAGWVLLAGALETSPEVVEAVAAQAWPGTDVVSRARTAAERGWAVSLGEREEGITGLAVPVTLPLGTAALAVGGPTGRLGRDDAEALVPRVQAAAAELAPHCRGLGT